jgi:hypothetical protein
MTFPKSQVMQRIHGNVDRLLEGGMTIAQNIITSEFSSPFRSTSQSGLASPFVKSLFPEIKLAATLERSLNTALGWGWDKIVTDIARATHGNGQVGYYVNGTIPATTAGMINDIVHGYTSGTGHSVPDTKAELAALLPTVSVAGARENVREKDDSYYVDSSGIENHIEIKTPKPNYDQLRASKRRILRIHVVRNPNTVKAIVGMPYNPNGRYGTYGWPTTPIFLDPKQDLLIGADFWNYIGNDNETYDQLLKCFNEVYMARRSDLLDLLEQA